MDPLQYSSRVVKVSQEDIDFSVNENSPYHHNKFDVTPAPISRPPSSYGNRLTKIQKIEPTKPRKRQKWNDRFHIETNEENIFLPIPTPIYKPKKLQRKQPKTYSKIHNISEKRKPKPKSSIIPPIDVVTGRRQWGKRNKKRAKWSTVKNKSIHNNIIHKNRKPKRAKWNKPSQITVDKSNPLTKSQSRVIPLLLIPKVAKSQTESINRLRNKQHNKIMTEKKEENSEDCSIKSSDKKQEFTELFSNVLQTVINKEMEEMNDVFNNVESKSEFDEEYTIETDSLIVQRNSNDHKNNNQRATRRILPISVSNRNKELIEQRKQYLDPLHQVADIILDDLIQDISEELNQFCCQCLDALIHSETNMTNC